MNSGVGNPQSLCALCALLRVLGGAVRGSSASSAVSLLNRGDPLFSAQPKAQRATRTQASR